MKNVVDIHTHTIVSGHAYTTLLENVREASKKGIKVLGVAEHGPTMPGGPNLFYFANINVIPREIEGLTILRGCEANIINYNGDIDIPLDIQENLDFIIASLHGPCIKSGSIEENTKAYLNVMENPNVIMIGHPGNTQFPIDYEVFIKKAKEKDIIIELNNSSFSGFRAGSEKNCYKIAQLCKEYKVKIMFSSDAHVCFSIGEFSDVEELIKDLNIPEELIMNNDENKIKNHLRNKGKSID